jgi:hypothetical protein
LQLWRDGQALEHTDVSTARITYWNDADSRSYYTQDDTNGLPERGSNSPSTDLHREHQPMGLRMGVHEGLADDVSALQVLKGALQIPSDNELSTKSDLSVESLAPLGVHLSLSMRPNTQFSGEGRAISPSRTSSAATGC